MVENWKPVVGFEGQYEVSDLGRVRSVDRVISYMKRDGRGGVHTVKQRCRGRVLRPGRQKSGHLHVQLGRKRTARVHTLVLEAFVSLAPDGLEGCHGDGRPSNNRLTNLRWDTHIANLADQERHGTKLLGLKNHMTRLTAESAAAIKRKKGNLSQARLAVLYGIGKTTVQAIHDGRTWRHV
jgi:DNA-binding transcriptional regulator YiaG